MLNDILKDLDQHVIDWYNSTDKSNIKSALIIGMNVVVSDNYKMNETDIVNKLNQDNSILQDQMESIIQDKQQMELLHETELDKEKSKNKDLEMNNEQTIKVAVDLQTQTIREYNNSLKDEKTTLKDEKQQLKEHLAEQINQYELLNNKFNDLNCNMKTSKIKGEITEHEVSDLIESYGYNVKKPGNHSGDLFVYSKENIEQLVCVLEIKNYGDDNKYKLGPGRSETNKMYKDIETQLNSDPPINCPWLFISLGCKIPNIGRLRNNHCGVKCFYLDEPSNKEIITWIECCEQISYLNSKKNANNNIIYMEQKINEICDILIKLQEDKPDFNGIKDHLNKSIKKLDKEDSKYKKKLDDTINRVNEIIKNSNYTPDDEHIDYTINTGELSLDQLNAYVKTLQRNAIRLNIDLNKSRINSIDASTSSTTETSTSDLETTTQSNTETSTSDLETTTQSNHVMTTSSESSTPSNSQLESRKKKPHKRGRKPKEKRTTQQN